MLKLVILNAKANIQNNKMAKSFSKNKSSQQRINYSQTWGEGQQNNNIFKLAKPPRRIPQQYMTTQHEYQQSIQQYNNEQENSRKIRVHKRKDSNFLNSQNQSNEYDTLAQFHQIRSHNITPVKLRKNESKNKIIQSQSSKQIEERFREIQSIMGLENQNLRQQKDYLLSTIYKMQAKEKEYKAQIAHYKQKANRIEQQNLLLRQKYEKAREFIATGIDKMEQVITKQQIQNISNSNTYHSNENSINNNSQQIQQLNDKFDALMYEYQKTRQPQIRKKCMQIAKQLRKLRKAEDEGELYNSNKNSRRRNK